MEAGSLNTAFSGSEAPKTRLEAAIFIGLNPRSNQCLRPSHMSTCAPIYEIPSNKNTMGHPHCFKGTVRQISHGGSTEPSPAQAKVYFKRLFPLFFEPMVDLMVSRIGPKRFASKRDGAIVPIHDTIKLAVNRISKLEIPWTRHVKSVNSLFLSLVQYKAINLISLLRLYHDIFENYKIS